jgi:hypothetical protein
MKRVEVTNKLLYRLSGVALLLGGGLGAAGQLFHPADPEGPAGLVQYASAAQTIHLLLFFAVMLILLGLPGVYARQSDKVGVPGLVGFLLLFFGLPLVDLIHSVVDFTVLPALMVQAPEQTMPVMMAAFEVPSWAILQMLGFPVLGLGIVLFAAMTIQARILSPWPAWLLAAAPAVGAIANFFPVLAETGTSFDGILCYLALAGFGYVLLADKASEPRPATAATLNSEQLTPQTTV